MKIGDKVIYKKAMKGLEPNTIGEIYSYHESNSSNSKAWAVVHYPQNIKTKYVDFHSANIEDLKYAKN